MLYYYYSLNFAGPCRHMATANLLLYFVGGTNKVGLGLSSIQRACLFFFEVREEERREEVKII